MLCGWRKLTLFFFSSNVSVVLIEKMRSRERGDLAIQPVGQAPRMVRKLGRDAVLVQRLSNASSISLPRGFPVIKPANIPSPMGNL